MKSKEEIEKVLEESTKNMVEAADMENIRFHQGAVKTLQWVLDDSEVKNNGEEPE